VADYVALLRSVNVAGHGRLEMAALRQAFTDLGFEEVRTYIQTGNVVFRSPKRNTRSLAAAIEGQVGRMCGASPAVIVRTAGELTEVLATSPYAARGADPARHHVTFLAEAPAAARLAAFVAPPSGRDELEIIGREVYVHTPDGYAGSKLSGTYLERHLGVVSTTRNWNTVAKLGALVGG